MSFSWVTAICGGFLIPLAAIQSGSFPGQEDHSISPPAGCWWSWSWGWFLTGWSWDWLRVNPVLLIKLVRIDMILTWLTWSSYSNKVEDALPTLESLSSKMNSKALWDSLCHTDQLWKGAMRCYLFVVFLPRFGVWGNIECLECNITLYRFS